ncbi:7 transmembrane receptor [Ancylostoma ceylanicum]|uniref:7 transmembrane receptor n=1 Tax=Ancylostoma ceylanicum TaxID=53326 RepID=A0A0D6MBQ3_9BILA|nr:7 transmembrane receptor [Ancylostoma ceylanicum]
MASHHPEDDRGCHHKSSLQYNPGIPFGWKPSKLVPHYPGKLARHAPGLREDSTLNCCCLLDHVTIGYIIILLVGLLGNVLAISVLRRHPLMKTHSTIYIMNLAMADLITLCVGLPFELIMNWSQYPWPFPDVFCNLKALIAETTNYASIMTILLFSIERYIAVFSSKMCMVAVLFDRSSLPMYKVIFHLSALLFFAIPLSIIFVLHILIALHVRSSRKDISRSDSVDDGNLRLTIILRFLFYLAPIVNPILYNVVSSRFRKATKDLLLSVFCPARLPRDSVMLRRSSVKYVMASRVDLHKCADITHSNPLV